jgi:hypothetical protein
MKRSSHKSALQERLFLRQEFAAIMRKGQWTLLPASLARKLKGLCISPIGVVLQRDHHPRTIMDYSFYNVNDDTALVAPNESMQFG